MAWFRTQNGNSLYNCDAIEVIEEKDGYALGGICSGTGVLLGNYDTEEQAVWELERIESWLADNYSEVHVYALGQPVEFLGTDESAL